MNLIKYFSWSISLVIIICVVNLIQINLLEQQYNKLPNLIFHFLFPLFIGIIIRLSLFFSEREKDNNWTFNWRKLIGVGLPFLYIAMGPLNNYLLGLPTLSSLSVYFLSDLILVPSGLICGFVIIDSLRKSDGRR